jgi:hypothetical protein
MRINGKEHLVMRIGSSLSLFFMLFWLFIASVIYSFSLCLFGSTLIVLLDFVSPSLLSFKVNIIIIIELSSHTSVPITRTTFHIPAYKLHPSSSSYPLTPTPLTLYPTLLSLIPYPLNIYPLELSPYTSVPITRTTFHIPADRIDSGEGIYIRIYIYIYIYICIYICVWQ